MIVIMLALAFVDSAFYNYIIFPVMCILIGYAIIKILNKIDSNNTPVIPTVTRTYTKTFAIYSTIITIIVVEIAHVISDLNDSMKLFYRVYNSSIQTTSFFGAINPIYVMIVAFIGLNLAWGYYYFKNSEKNWKDIIPYLGGIILIVAFYFMNLSKFITG